MNRRSFVSSAVAPLLMAAPPAPSYGIIDTHIHFYDPTRPHGVPWPPKDDSLLYRRVMPDDFRRVAEPLDVIGAVVVEASAWLADNQWILDLAQDNPIIRGFIGNLTPGSTFRLNLAKYSRNPLFRGIRLTIADLRRSDSEFIDHMKRLADKQLVLDVLGSASMFGPVMRLADRVPKLRIVINHLPFQTNVDGLAKLAEYPWIYAKVSGYLRPDGLEQVWSAFGPGRLLYGSNWPVSERAGSYATRLAVVREFFESKSPEAAAQYFRLNAKSVYNAA